MAIMLKYAEVGPENDQVGTQNDGSRVEIGPVQVKNNQVGVQNSQIRASNGFAGVKNE